MPGPLVPPAFPNMSLSLHDFVSSLSRVKAKPAPSAHTVMLPVTRIRMAVGWEETDTSLKSQLGIV